MSAGKKTVEIEKDIMYNAINLGINMEALPDKKERNGILYEYESISDSGRRDCL